MTNMFKKSLLALAVVGFASNASAAILTNATPTQASNQYLATSDEVALPATVTITAGANYAENDLIKLTVSGAEVAMADFEPIVAFTGGIANLNLLSVTKSGSDYVALYRVTDVTGSTNGVATATIIETGATIVSAKVTGNVTLSFEAETSGGFAVDTGGTAAQRKTTLLKKFDQFATLDAGTSFEDIIDVADERDTFEGGDVVSNGGTFTIEQQEADPVFVGTDVATVTSVDYTLTGNFSWALDEDGELVDAAAVAPTCTGGAIGASLEVTASEATWTCTGVNTGSTVSLDTTDKSTTTIPTSDFVLSATVKFDGDDESGSTALTVDAGSWKLNGAEVNIPYMPYGDTITQVINLNNAGTQTGDITVEGFDRAGNDFGPVVVGSAAPGKQIALAEAIKTALTTAGIASNERVSLKIVANVPAADVTVYSAYNTSGNGARIVVNSSNGK